MTTSELSPKPEPIEKRCVVELYDLESDVNKSFFHRTQLVNSIIRIHRMFFHDFYIPAFYMEFLQNPSATNVFIFDPIKTITDKANLTNLIGYTLSLPTTKVYTPAEYGDRIALEDTAYILETAILPDYHGHHLTQKMMSVLETNLKLRGFKYIERDATEKYHFAESIRKNYEGRIEIDQPLTSEYGPQVFFRIRL